MDQNNSTDSPHQSKSSPQSSSSTRSRHHHLYPQIIAAAIVSWMSVIVGYSTAYSSPSTISIMHDLKLDRDQISWIWSLLPIGALIGGLAGGVLMEMIGRKKTLLVTDFVFLIGWSMIYFSSSRTHYLVYLSRILCGCSVGIVSCTVPIYLAETVQPKIRGRLGILPTAFGNFGILLCYFFGSFFEWRGLAEVGIIGSLPFLILVWIIPETPRWYLRRGGKDKARVSLQWFRGPKTDVQVEITNLLAASGRQDVAKVRILKRGHLRALGIVLGLMFLQQFSGINAVIFYTDEIFAKAESAKTIISPSTSATIVGVVNFMSTFLAAVLVDRLGRKVLIYISCCTVASTLLVLGMYFCYLDRFDYDLQYVPLFALVVYDVGFSMGLGPVPWLMMAELLPASVRGPCAALCSAFNWTCTFVVIKFFPIVSEVLGAHVVFWFFAAWMVVGVAFVCRCVPETKKKSLEEIEMLLGGS